MVGGGWGLGTRRTNNRHNKLGLLSRVNHKIGRTSVAEKFRRISKQPGHLGAVSSDERE
jgi:hypothetical protein